MTLIDDWQIGPRNRWAYQHVGEVVPTVRVACQVGARVARHGARARARHAVAELVPEVAESGYRGATLRHLMDMTAATDFVEDYTNFWRYDVASGWHSPQPGVPGSILEYLATIGPAQRPHGSLFHYVSLRDYVRFGAFVLERSFSGLGERPIEDPRAIGYGSQWWRLPGGVLAARGIHGQMVAVDRGSRTVTVMLSSWPAATDPEAQAAQFDLLVH